MATRMRTYDMLGVADAIARRTPELFSLEMWGGATFDTAMRFLQDDPWERLRQLRERIPNICFQMLFQGIEWRSAIRTIPDNVVEAFVKHRRWRLGRTASPDLRQPQTILPTLTVAMDACQGTGAVCEAAICYTGGVEDPRRDK